MGLGGARQGKAGDTEAAERALGTAPKCRAGGTGNWEPQGRGRRGTGIWGRRYRKPGRRGAGGRRRTRDRRTEGTGGFWCAKKGTAGQETASLLRRGEKGHSGDRENTVRGRKSAEEPCVAGKVSPSRAAPGRGSRSARSGAGSPAPFPGHRSEPHRKASGSPERLRARSGRGRAPVLPGVTMRSGAGEGSSAPAAASSGRAGGPGDRVGAAGT